MDVLTSRRSTQLVNAFTGFALLDGQGADSTLFTICDIALCVRTALCIVCPLHGHQMVRLCKSLPRPELRALAESTRASLEEFKENVPIINAVCNPGANQEPPAALRALHIMTKRCFLHKLVRLRGSGGQSLSVH